MTASSETVPVLDLTAELDAYQQRVESMRAEDLAMVERRRFQAKITLALIAAGGFAALLKVLDSQFTAFVQELVLQQ